MITAPQTGSAKKSIYLPGLNGLRAIAAVLVVLCHTTSGLSRYPVTKPAWLTQVFELSAGDDSVTLFFVISGFLITYLLLKEKAASGSIHIKKFYLRRILRIWPLYFFYMIVVVGLSVLLHYSFAFHFLPYYIFFAGNIALPLGASENFFLRHYWSLGVEEQFYIFWPAFMRYINKRFLPVLVAIAMALTALGVLVYFGIITSRAIVIFSESHFQCMGIGGIFGWLYFSNSRALAFCRNKIVNTIALVLMALMVTHTLYFSFLHTEVVALLSAIIIIAVTANSCMVKFENRVCNYLGKISYGIYVYHPLLIWLFSTRVFKHTTIPGGYLIWLVYFCVTLSTIATAALSYHFLELPFLRMKKKFSIVVSSGTPVK